MISRNEELERNQGKWVAMNRAFKNKKKYNRNDKKKELRNNLNSYFLVTIYLLTLMFDKSIGLVRKWPGIKVGLMVA